VRSRTWAVIAALIAFAGAAAAKSSDFQARANLQAELYDKLLQQPDVKQALLEGRGDQVADRMVALVPEPKRTAVDYFIVSNRLFRVDDDRSRKLLMRAELLDPVEPTILVERGLHEHRRGDCAAAIAYYEKAQKSTEGKNSQTLWAYSTHCYLRLGRVDDAFRAWPAALFSQHHTEIETAMYAVFGPPSPSVRRDALLKKVRDGRTDLLCDVLHNDTHWEADWWNVGEHKQYADYDRELAQKKLKAGSAELRQFALCDHVTSLDQDAFKKELAELGIWDGAKGKLPASPALSRAILTRLTSDKLADEAALLKAYEKPLRANLKAQRDATEWAELLAYLYVSTHDDKKLREIDDFGWHQLHLPKFAESYVYGLQSDPAKQKLELARALKEFPNSALLRQLDLRFKADTPEKGQALVQLVAAQFAHVGEPGEHRLNDYMASLKHELKEPAAADKGAGT